MTNNELIAALVEAVGYDPDEKYGMYHIGSALSKEEQIAMTQFEYSWNYYPKIRKMIENLPWIDANEMLPPEDGRYLTLLDCNEHEIDKNSIELKPDGKRHWSWCDRHVCYWMPIPEKNDNPISWKKSKMNWHDGGQRMY